MDWDATGDCPDCAWWDLGKYTDCPKVRDENWDSFDCQYWTPDGCLGVWKEKSE